MTDFGRVDVRADRVLIVCTGPSAAGVDVSPALDAGVYVLGVNSAVRVFPCSAFFTCDPGPLNRELMARQRAGVRYFAAVPNDYGTPRAAAPAHRAPPEPGVTYLRRLTGPGPWSHRFGLSRDVGAVHTGNSAYGALGVAYHMGARRIAFVGLDGGGGTYVPELGGAPGPLDHLPGIFSTACNQLRIAGVAVRNGSPRSAVRCFERCTPEEALAWIC